MLWFIGSAAIVLLVIMAFSVAETRWSVIATIGVLAILGVAAGGFLYFEQERSAERVREARRLAQSEKVDITDATLTKEYGAWHFRGTLVNHSGIRIGGMTVHVTIQDCPGGACKTIGEADASTVGLHVPPQGTGRFDLRVDFGAIPSPSAMKWDYDLREVVEGRE